MRGLLNGICAFLALGGIGASIGYFLREPYNTGFLEHPVVVGSHVVLGAGYLVFAPFQFVAGVRRRWPAYHRAVGRGLVACGIALGASAFFIATVIHYSGWPERVVNGFFALYFTLSLVLAFGHARARRIERHREWMIRAFSIGLVISTMRLIFVPALFAFGPASPELAADLSILSFTIAFGVHAAAAEWWIRRTRRGAWAPPHAATHPA